MYTNFYKNWINILRNCNYDNTYKMAWAKAITEIAVETKFDRNKDIYNEIITLEQIAHKMVKYYWNQTIFFNLIQGSNPLKPPAIITLVKELIDYYYEFSNAKKPIRFEKLDLEDNLKTKYEKTIKKTITILKKDVSHRFINLPGIEPESIYTYKQGQDYLEIKISRLKILKINNSEIFETINYRWALILETFNSTPRICKKVKIIDEKDIKRSSLNKFSKYLDYENPEHICFICNKKIEEDISIDHVIPWSYLYSDDLWNLVYVHKSCNSSKSNSIPNEDAIKKLQERNTILLNHINKNLNNKVTEDLKLAIEKNYVEKYWIACQG